MIWLRLLQSEARWNYLQKVKDVYQSVVSVVMVRSALTHRPTSKGRTGWPLLSQSLPYTTPTGCSAALRQSREPRLKCQRKTNPRYDFRTVIPSCLFLKLISLCRLEVECCGLPIIQARVLVSSGFPKDATATGSSLVGIFRRNEDGWRVGY